MTTSPVMSLQSINSRDGEPLSPFEIGYLTAAAQDGAYDTVLRIFLGESARDPRITRAFLARRTGMNPAQVTRYLGGPGNWTLETYAKLLAAMGYVPKIEATKFSDLRWSNEPPGMSPASTGTGSSPIQVVALGTGAGAVTRTSRKTEIAA